MDARISVMATQETNEDKTIACIYKLVKLWTPVDTGNLLKSFYRSGSSLGFTAPYAVYVHENSNALHKPPTRYKFLEDAAIMGATECGFIGRITITYEPLTIYLNSVTGSVIYEKEV
jgi:hypothetical protein